MIRHPPVRFGPLAAPRVVRSGLLMPVKALRSWPFPDRATAECWVFDRDAALENALEDAMIGYLFRQKPIDLQKLVGIAP